MPLYQTSKETYHTAKSLKKTHDNLNLSERKAIATLKKNLAIIIKKSRQRLEYCGYE